ncbi:MULTISPECIES: globin domain-containing protein [Aeromonas]|uniref:globin domain-containing protein n=1 Tax=Aeromonas TaxID=642 RepID=UPI00051AE78F|nr:MULTISPECIES: globin domain-containing protein [Aeromonas]MCH7370606.1 globin domain-containing protein [Aeromonas sp. MR16]
MTTAQIELVQKAWGKVTALNTSYVLEVYEELFRQSPELINLFPDPSGMPIAKVSETLNTVITSLEQLDALGFIIRDLGRRHQKFNVQPHQFALLKQALTTVLARRLGESFKPELAEAWSQMYDEISTLMQEGLNQRTTSLA